MSIEHKKALDFLYKRTSVLLRCSTCESDRGEELRESKCLQGVISFLDELRKEGWETGKNIILCPSCVRKLKKEDEK